MTERLVYAQNLLKALEFAAEKHRDQRRKGVEASPYINHPIQVAQVLATFGQVDDLTTLMAAILHDTIEDTDTTKADLDKLFGNDVGEVVSEVTDDKSLPKQERKRRQVEHTPHLSDRARQIKIADKICNVRDIGSRPPADWNDERRKEYFDWARAVIGGCRGVNRGLEDYFDECVAESKGRLERGSCS
jgi:guanosine-3',5'-bis(diphosphate) 3'-pyrophosphohydrolase